MKKVLGVLFTVAVLAAGARAAQKLQHRVKVSQVNEWQAIVSCRNGRNPTVDTKSVPGLVIVSCEGRDE